MVFTQSSAGRESQPVRRQQIADLRLAAAQAQHDPTFRTPLAYTRLTAKAAVAELRAQGFSQPQVPAPSTMATLLNRLGFRRRQVLKAKPQKKIAQTEAIFENLKKRRPSGR